MGTYSAKDVKLVIHTPNGETHELIGFTPDVILIDDVDSMNSLLYELKTASPRLFGCGPISVQVAVSEEDSQALSKYYDRLHQHQIDAIKNTMREFRSIGQPRHGPRGKWGKLKSR